MGLDMFLFKGKRVNAEEIVKENNFNDLLEIGYWRKFNALHHWLVENVQDGVDDGGQYEVTREHLLTLQEVITKLRLRSVLVSEQLRATIARNLFPTASGFFFGSTDYDSWYWDDVEELSEQLETILANLNDEEDILFYYASW